MVNSYFYSYDRTKDKVTQSAFTPTQYNWMLNAQKGSTDIYFPNVTSFNNWSGGCCGQSYNAVTSGQLGDYTIKHNL
ncbi:MAG: hypothetical protein RR744_08375 [Cellulosilyticaceae bacterium]